MKATELRKKEGDLRTQCAELQDLGEDLEDKRTDLQKTKNEVASLRTALAKSEVRRAPPQTPTQLTWMFRTRGNEPRKTEHASRANLRNPIPLGKSLTCALPPLRLTPLQPKRAP